MNLKLLLLSTLTVAAWALEPTTPAEDAPTSLVRRTTPAYPTITTQAQLVLKNRTACGCGIGHFPSTLSYADCGFANGDPFARYTCDGSRTCTADSGHVYCSGTSDAPDIRPFTSCVDFDHYHTLKSVPCLTCQTLYCTSGYSGYCGTIDFGSSTGYMCHSLSPYYVRAFTTATNYTATTNIVPTTAFNYTSAGLQSTPSPSSTASSSGITPQLKRIIIYVVAGVSGLIALIIVACCICCCLGARKARKNPQSQPAVYTETVHPPKQWDNQYGVPNQPAPTYHQ